CMASATDGFHSEGVYTVVDGMLYAVELANVFLSFFFNEPPTTEIYTLSLHDALPILAHELLGGPASRNPFGREPGRHPVEGIPRSEEHTSELQSLAYLVCRLLLEKKKQNLHTGHDSSHYHPPHLD